MKDIVFVLKLKGIPIGKYETREDAERGIRAEGCLGTPYSLGDYLIIEEFQKCQSTGD